MANRIGVYDEETLLRCLKNNYQLALGVGPEKDPQAMIQDLAATVMNFQRALLEIVSSEFEGSSDKAKAIAMRCLTAAALGR